MYYRKINQRLHFSSIIVMSIILKPKESNFSKNIKLLIPIFQSHFRDATL